MTDAPVPQPIRGHNTQLEYHRRMLDDHLRVAAFERAIRQLVKPGDVVLDVGTGTGILAMLAARRGARVHAVESMRVADVAEAIIRANKLDHRITLHRADIVDMEPIEPVDIVLADYMGRVVVDDGMMRAAEAGKRWLKEGGVCCPARWAIMLGAVGDIVLRPVDLWTEPFFGLNMEAALGHALSSCYHVRLQPHSIVGPPAEYVAASLGADVQFDHTVTLEIRRDTRLRGVAGWFDADMAPGVAMSTAPGTESHWDQYLFPLPPTHASAGDVLAFRLEVRGAAEWSSYFAWSGDLTRNGVVVMTFRQTSRQFTEGQADD